tara:strand:- start:3602 stop:4468 length:867 start_codon:yes stop_codon:yes gene_type:complete
MNGYIKLHRKILENPIVMKSNDHLAVWMYLLLNATHKSYDTILEGRRITLQPGQLITGRKVISKCLKINESKIQRILKTFKIEQQIEQQTNPRCRLISIVNWSEYQHNEQQNEQQVNNKRTLNKNVKNIKNIYNDDFLEFWSMYPKKVGKPKANSSYKKSLKVAEHSLIINSLKSHLISWQGKDLEFIPNPTTWLNQERFNDEVVKPSKKIETKLISKKYQCYTCDSMKESDVELMPKDLLCGCGDLYISKYEYDHRKAQGVPSPKQDNDDNELIDISDKLGKLWSMS